MVNTYLLTYLNKPLGLYSKMSFLFDFILEMFNIPQNNLNLYKFKIYEYEVNRGYPINTFKFNKSNNKLIFLEESEKRVEMNRETFLRFIKIKNRCFKPDKEIQKQEEVPKKDVILDEKEIDKIKEEKEQVKDELKETIAELNKMKNRNKKIQNWYSKFNNDKELFLRFTEEINNNPDFVIPELFQDTFKFFQDVGTESFTDYFVKFNEDSELDFEELEKYLNELDED